ncbi:L-seryl-tRNA(Sec) selenium transferase [Desulfonatronovibrio magnus]|uniref:L-seryl-tRNA(Sec) selenium transferase n=1 Tax=Desulfonatronovibrio magnus TaxID=698827 RepID=UPI0005EB19BA|nr:L-seryl-tRNA(Sec) selenium transferase [Desulfonatronovibrio magnus]RQD65489.1 MAG: L-seryl-tRNA(Sec) selenium transferase [Desulfonatronovibrio sp. MSAO_Bac4]
MSSLFRLLPSVDSVLSGLADKKCYSNYPRAFIRDLVNDFLELCRQEIKAGTISGDDELSPERFSSRLEAYLKVHTRPHFRRVINATGVVIHTNLGRSILNRQAAQAVWEACLHYSNLEFSLNTGKRGSRYSHVEELLCRITGAEAGLVVNNNASAVLIILDTLAKGREVVVSRGQLVEIGGSFRIPDVMAKSGAFLKEVGATNRTHLKDYESVINENTGALLKVHTSNYRIIGFHKEVTLKELVQLGDKHGLPVIEDMGSGNFFDFPGHGYHFMPEPTVQQVVKDGVSVVSFSGDKLLGGPQAGIIVGREKIISKIKKNPMNRAIRIDKMTLAALESTLRFYLDSQVAMREVPTLRMITMKQEELKKAAQKLMNRIRRSFGNELKCSIFPANSRVGGGSFPEQDLPTYLVGVKSDRMNCEQLKEKLLRTDPPLIGMIVHDLFCLDPRTLDVDEFGLVVEVLGQALEV